MILEINHLTYLLGRAGWKKSAAFLEACREVGDKLPRTNPNNSGILDIDTDTETQPPPPATLSPPATISNIKSSAFPGPGPAAAAPITHHHQNFN